MSKISIPAMEDGVRLDVLIAGSIDTVSRSGVQKLIETGAVTCRGEPVKKNLKVRAGQVFELEIPEPQRIEIVPQDIPLDIVYEDEDVIVINKPKGMVVHPAPGHPDGTLVNALMYHCGDSLSGINGEIRPGIVHRIDKDTSGLIIAAKNNEAHMKLALQLQDHSLSRIYEAVVYGSFSQDSGTVTAAIGRHPTDRKRQTVGGVNPREAVTHWEVIARYSGWTHVGCRLETGRTHQIRVHMAHIGHPLLGDMVYGHKKAEKGLEGQCLHARSLKFTHPRSGETVELTTELPEYFTGVLGRLGNIL